MANPCKGKFLLLCLLFIFVFLPSCRNLIGSVAVSDQEEEHRHASCHEPQTEIQSKVNPGQQDILLHRLEELVRNLSEIVTKLSAVSDASCSDERQRLESLRLALREKEKINRRKLENQRDVEEKYKIQDGEKTKGVSVTKYSPFWSESFRFVSAVKLESDATCINILPFRDYEGLSKYVAVGDDRGRVYMLLRNGDVSVEYYTQCESPVTAMVSYMSGYKNESIVVTGHQNGVILIHRVYENSNGEDWSSLTVENVAKSAAAEKGEERLAITILEVHHVGRKRYILSADVSGKISVFTEDGKVRGSVMPASRALAFLKQRLLFLTETGAGSLDLRTMKVKESECEGLNKSLARKYVFDATERSRAYGYTSDGDLIHLLLLGDVTNFKCRVRSKRKFETNEPMALQAIKGYLLIINEEKASVYNVSSHQYVRSGGPRLLFSANVEEIRSSFLNYQTADMDMDSNNADEKRHVIPLIASDREKLLVLGLGGGYVGLYRSKLAIFKGESNVMQWTNPVLFFILFLFGAWHFFAKKKEALTSWGPDDPFTSTSTTAGAPMVSVSGERSFADSSSRSSDVMELRSGGLRGPSGRYGSPSRYPGGATTSFRPSSVDPSARPPIDPNFRSASELKFRGPALESTGYPKRRESLYVNNQAADSSN